MYRLMRHVERAEHHFYVRRIRVRGTPMKRVASNAEILVHDTSRSHDIPTHAEDSLSIFDRFPAPGCCTERQNMDLCGSYQAIQNLLAPAPCLEDLRPFV